MAKVVYTVITEIDLDAFDFMPLCPRLEKATGSGRLGPTIEEFLAMSPEDLERHMAEHVFWYGRPFAQCHCGCHELDIPAPHCRMTSDVRIASGWCDEARREPEKTKSESEAMP